MDAVGMAAVEALAQQAAAWRVVAHAELNAGMRGLGVGLCGRACGMWAFVVVVVCVRARVCARARTRTRLGRMRGGRSAVVVEVWHARVLASGMDHSAEGGVALLRAVG